MGQMSCRLCVQDLVFTAVQYVSVCNMLYVLSSLSNGRRLLPVEARRSVQPLACYILVHYLVQFCHLHNPRCCLRLIRYPSTSRIVRLSTLLGVKPVFI